MLASDIDTNVLEKAAAGVYDADRAADLPPQLIKKYFARESRAADAPIHVKPTLRDLITFRRINLQDATWPIKTQFDVIFCRNVMIYFDTDSQRRIISHFGQYLKSEGHLIVGHSESLLGLTDRFQLHGETIYRHTGVGSPSAIPPASKSTTRIAVQKPQTKTRRETSVSSSGTRQLTAKHSLPTASSESAPTALPGKTINHSWSSARQPRALMDHDRSWGRASRCVCMTRRLVLGG